MKARDLVWKEMGKGFCFAETPFGDYDITREDGSYRVVLGDGKIFEFKCRSIERSKRAAQDDFNQRVSESISNIPSDNDRLTMKWLPIDTAPRGSGKEGWRPQDYEPPPMLLLWAVGDYVIGCYEWFYNAWHDQNNDVINGVTHWTMLPGSPIPSDAEG